MKKQAHTIEVGEKIDWYGHGEILERGTVTEKYFDHPRREVVFVVDDKNTSDKPFPVRKPVDEEIIVFHK